MREKTTDAEKKDICGPLKEAIIRAYLRGGSTTKLELAEAVARQREERSVKTAVYARLASWERMGRLFVQSHPDVPDHHLSVFNFRMAPTGCASLADALTPFLRDPEIAAWKKSHARAAVRFLLGLPTRCAETRIVEAARDVQAVELRDLIGRAYDSSLAKGDSRNTAQNFRRGIARVLEYGARHDLIPLVFPPLADADPWRVAAARYFPYAGQETSSGRACSFSRRMRDKWRRTWLRFGSAAEVACANDPASLAAARDPATVTEVMLQAVRKQLVSEAEFELWQQVSAMFNSLGRTCNVGPRKDRSPGTVARLYLAPPEGSELTVTDLEDVCRLIAESGFSSEWSQFLQWYAVWARADRASLRRNGYPPRKNARPIGASRFEHRLMVVRAFLGIATSRLGMDPAELSPVEVFGHRFEPLMDALCDAWAERAEYDPRVSAPFSGGLKEIVIAGGLLAYALHRRLGHERGQEFGTITGRRGGRRLDRAEEAMAKSTDQDACYRAYELSVDQSKLIAEEIQKRSGSPSGKTTIRDVRLVWKRTPPSYWVSILQGFLNRIADFRKVERPITLKYAKAVFGAYSTALHISTGMRGEEVTHVRLDIQYRPENRRMPQRIIDLRDQDRKNGAHSVVVHPEILPAWLEDEWLTTVRPFLIERGIEEGKLAADLEQHPWLLVDLYGRPFGCPEESLQGANRDPRRISARKNAYHKLWKREAGRMARTQGLQIPTERGYFSRHCIRAVMGYLIRSKLGDARACDYLGDGLEAVRSYYAPLDAQNIDVTALDVQWADDRSGPLPLTNSSGEADGALDQLDRLERTYAEIDARADKLGLSGEIVQALKEQAKQTIIRPAA